MTSHMITCVVASSSSLATIHHPSAAVTSVSLDEMGSLIATVCKSLDGRQCIDREQVNEKSNGNDIGFHVCKNFTT